ncbi:MAG: alpha/beta fold hydrolase [Halobacteriales archaeon]
MPPAWLPAAAPDWLVPTAKRLFVWLVVAALVASSAVVGYAGTPYDAEPQRLDAVREGSEVVVEEHPHGYVLRDADPDGERVGLVFYPGARVEAAAYLWTLAPLVERTDVRVYVPEMPLHFAVLDPGRAADVLDGDVPLASGSAAVDRWYVGGHSLGGAMACRFGANNPERVEGVVLAAAYCGPGNSLSDADLDVLAVWGSRDGVLDERRVQDRSWAPGDARFVELDGVNHAQFGAYGDQSGDRDQAVDDRTARERIVATLTAWFRDRGGETAGHG